jgi:23S rRNA pseudouridine2605 synthase
MSEDNHKPERIAKRLARAGLCSRREAERRIAEGRISVNGKTLESPAVTVTPQDEIIVDGKPLPDTEKTRLFIYHKTSGLVTTSKDEKGRPTIYDKLPEDLPRLISVGRLDMSTEGLLLLTNDGELARLLELPSNGWKRRYRVRVHGRLDEEKLKGLEKGITVEGVKYGPVEVSIDHEGTNSWLTLSLREGKNREIRKLMESMGLKVNRLIRTAYGPFQLGKLPKGAVREITGKVLKEQLPEYFR